MRKKIDDMLSSEMVTIGVDVEHARTGIMWAYDSERLSKRTVALFQEEIKGIGDEALLTRKGVEDLAPLDVYYSENLKKEVISFCLLVAKAQRDKYRQAILDAVGGKK